MKQTPATAVAVLGLWLAAQSVLADTTLFILDVSGSMARALGGETRIAAAKRTLGDLVSELPEGLEVGLEVYGHYGDKDCSAIEVVVPPGRATAGAVKTRVQGLSPAKGATPIAEALVRAGEVLKPAEGARSIVLISDGEETCGGDPQAVAARLRGEGYQVTTHVIGLGVGEKERAQLQAVASAGQGQYYDAADAAALKASLQQVKKQVAADPVVFRDDFGGEAVDPRWEVVNPDPDAMIVEDGMLQILTQVPEKALFNPRNLLLYKGELPKAYEIELKVLLTQMEGSCARWTEAPMVGVLLYKDAQNAIALVAGKSPNRCGSDRDAVIYRKIRKGQWAPGFHQDLGAKREDHPVTLRLRREKRKFIAFYENAKGEWVKLGEFSELRPSYRLALFALKGSSGAHESLEKVDWIELRELR